MLLEPEYIRKPIHWMRRRTCYLVYTLRRYFLGELVYFSKPAVIRIHKCRSYSFSVIAHRDYRFAVAAEHNRLHRIIGQPASYIQCDLPDHVDKILRVQLTPPRISAVGLVAFFCLREDSSILVKSDAFTGSGSKVKSQNAHIPMLLRMFSFVGANPLLYGIAAVHQQIFTVYHVRGIAGKEQYCRRYFIWIAEPA